ncbi:hsp90-like protein [Xylariales sp. AK1849]|nr:hsp90-like protein [Xylariales sp. AK1849]
MSNPSRHPSTSTDGHVPEPDDGSQVATTVSLRGGGGFDGPESPLGKNARLQDANGPGTGAAQAGKKKKGKGVSIAQGSPDVIDSQSVILQYQERLARELGRREMAIRSPQSAAERKRVSPIREELSLSPASASAYSSDLPTASTESSKTVRGGTTPAFTPGLAARTPSYPFPRMGTPGYAPSAFQRAFNNQLQSGILNATGGQFEYLASNDQLRSDPSTPASAMTFQPPGATPMVENPEFPTPNIYELALMLTAEPGLDAWWSAVVQIMRQHFRAERVTLSVPADATDLENVPWGQKATFSSLEEDRLSMAYMGRGSSMMLSSTDEQSERGSNLEGSQKSERIVRPDFQSRHSFTSYEDKKESRASHLTAFSSSTKRPTPMPRSKSYFPATHKRPPSSPHAALNKQALEEHDAVEEQQHVPSWEAPLVSRREVKGRVLPVLQGLELEADPLIDHNGVKRVVERGKVIALTRSYPYLDATVEEKSKRKAKKPTRTESGTKLSSLLGNAAPSRPGNRSAKNASGNKSKMSSVLSAFDDDEPRPRPPQYEEYEQAPPSPWSQSPAPSPAVRAEPNENPFFTDAMVDEDSFEPGSSPHDYSNIQAPETIGIDNSWTVLHIPLKHLLLSKPAQTFKLSSAALGQRNAQRSNLEATAESYLASDRASPPDSSNNHQSPIAILSILSPVIPYPSNLRYSLEYLAPHLATSFSLCRHYSNMETEVAGIHRKRPSTAGFGALGPDGRPMVDPALFAQLNYASSEDPLHQSITGSLTSPSDYSRPSQSAAGSPGGLAAWDSSPFGLVVDRHATGTSPSQVGGDGYFTATAKSRSGPGDGGPRTPGYRPGRGHKETTSSVERMHGRSSSWQGLRPEMTTSTTEQNDLTGTAAGDSEHTTEEKVPTVSTKTRFTSKEATDQARNNELRSQKESGEMSKIVLGQSSSGQGGHKHTMLHSHGADFATTFQSLPSGSSLNSPNRSGQEGQVSMLPPSDRLKGLMLDSLPAHVFVALPTTGEIVWVNSRYLSYRGQTVADLIVDPWGSVHPEDRDLYLQNWTHSLRTGEQFAYTVRLRRFDGEYRWHQARAIASKDKRGVIVQFIGSYMDIHDQKIAELMAARQEEVEASEAKHRLLANLIPQIIFAATEEDGITFANEQWLSYTGQSFQDSLGVGFMDYVHPDDLAKCRIPPDKYAYASETPTTIGAKTSATVTPTKLSVASLNLPVSRHGSSSSSSNHDMSTADLGELAKKGIVKVATDSTGRLSYTTELRLRSRTGEYRWHLIRCVQINNINFGTGESSYFGSATDINDHKLLEAKLKEAMESKSRFLSNMSHEIRTPLIGISGMVSFLQDTTLNEEQRDYTNTIQTSANSLLMIINDILDLSKVDAGMMKLSFEWFHTRSLIEDVNELVSTMAIAKRLELNYVIEEDVPLWVKGDKVRIRQVLLNVIGNAIKFTSQGEVFSRCKIASDFTKDQDERDVMLEFSVVDTGSGFTKEEAELIFKPFSQIDGSSTRQHGGSGLGLVISRQLVELHGGKMDGSASPGKGSTFTFTAKFGLPTRSDHPDGTDPLPTVPSRKTSLRQTPSDESSTSTIRPLSFQRIADAPFTSSPGSDAGVVSPTIASSASSDPSVPSLRTQNTARSSMSSVNVGLAHFSEAAKASGQDLSQMKLEIPPGGLSPSHTPTPDLSKVAGRLDQLIPPMYSILIICPQTMSREATTKHIEITLPKNIPHQITAVASVAEAQKLIGGDEAVTFTHIVINLATPPEIIGMVDQIISSSGERTSILILSDSVQRQAVLKLATDSVHQKLLAQNMVSFIYKPVKPSRFAAVFDPSKSGDLSIDRNRSSAAIMVESQKQSYLDVEKRIGNKGYKVLLVEDNPVNQKVLIRYLKKVGIVAEVASDGVECTEAVFSHPPGFYSLILCDLHMPRKDGYQACREIRKWEKKGNYRRLPIIALSANVMSDVQEKCVEAGFSAYVTKPVDFIDLSTTMSKFF